MTLEMELTFLASKLALVLESLTVQLMVLLLDEEWMHQTCKLESKMVKQLVRWKATLLVTESVDLASTLEK